MINNKLPALCIDFLGKKLKNPVVSASGCFSYGLEQRSLLPPSLFGAITLKGLSARPKKGNPPVRIVETSCGLLNSIGLENIGIEAFMKAIWPSLRALETPIIVNFFGDDEEEFLLAADMLNELDDILALELNLSCPNKPAWGKILASDPLVTGRLVRLVKRVTRHPLIVKLSPNVTSITDIAKSAEDNGADAISLINTLQGMVIDVERRTSKLGSLFGGLSGPSIRPVALRMVYEVVRVVSVPVIGVGGIMNHEDALSFFIVGAKVVEVGTLLFVNPKGVEEIIQGISIYLARHHMRSIDSLIGSMVDA